MKKQGAADAGRASEPTLNNDLLQQYAQKRTGLLERLVAAYLEEAPNFHQNIRRGGEVQDFDLVKLNAHALKSSSYNLGAVRLSKLCQELENSAGRQDISELNHLLGRLSPECFEVEEALKGAIYRLTGRALADAHKTIAHPIGGS
jgi:HPt (histidine-containing phosphotransfer) domain-containing protein